MEKHRGACNLRHRTYARFRIGNATHNPDVVCTTSTRVEMQLFPRNLAIRRFWVTRESAGDTRHQTLDKVSKKC
jgi:hypothetical protein